MGDWSMLEGQLVDTVGEVLASTQGTTVTGGNANEKGGWTQIIAATTYNADGLLVILNPSGAYRYLVDIGIGAAESEVVLIPNLHIATGQSNLPYIYFFPISIPAGTRIAARHQNSQGVAAIYVTVILYSQGFLPSAPLHRVTAYGADATDSGGVSIDPGGVAHTKNAYYQINGATANPIRALLVVVGGQANTARTSCTWLIDIAIGPADSERIILPDLLIADHSTGDNVLPGVFGPFPIDIPAGTRLAARAQCSITDETDRLFDIVLLGID